MDNIFAQPNEKGRGGREVTLDILILGYIVVGVLATVIIKVYTFFYASEYDGAPAELVFIFPLFYLALLFFRKAGFVKPIAIIFLVSIILPIYYTSYKWSLLVPLGYLLYGLSIIISGAILGSKAPVIVLFFHSFYLLSLNLAERLNLIVFDTSWAKEPPTNTEAIQAIAILSLSVLISWLSNREIEKALKRARKSEENLKKERDMLEVKVDERTRQIRNERMKQIMALYRFADFGRLAAGLFHDLVDPLSVISLNLENLKHETRRKMLNDENKATIRSALKIVMENQYRIEEFVKATRRQLQGQQTKARFNLQAEIDCVFEGLIPKANASRVSLDFRCPRPVFTFGNPVRFHQLMLNLVSNAIDAYDGIRRRKNRMVIVELVRQEKQAICSVKDFGSGISVNHLSQIFTPFFTTKPLDKGIGIGLSIAKEIVERDFKGEISVKSRFHKETLFTVKFPLVS